MKNKLNYIGPFLLIALLSAENVFSQSTNSLSSPNAPGRGQRRGNANNNNNDAFYKLGPDSMPMNGVPPPQIRFFNAGGCTVSAH